MTNTPKHTPTPWTIESDSGHPHEWVINAKSEKAKSGVHNVGKIYCKSADKDFIVTAVNAHEELVLALKRISNMNDAATMREEAEEALRKAGVSL